MIPIAALRDKHAGKVAVVLGGGPSLRDDYKKTPQNAVLIGVNLHWLDIEHRWLKFFMVFLDEPKPHSNMMMFIKSRYSGVKVSPIAQWSDIDLTGADWWHGNFSSHLGTWLACWMGCDPVLLCGMDCYQGERSEDADPRDNAYNTPLEEHLAGWREAFKRCPNTDRIKAVSGPLVEIFGKYEVKS
jgi:hypothetical protein